MADGVWETPEVIKHCDQLLLNTFFDLSTRSLKKQTKKEEKTGEERK